MDIAGIGADSAVLRAIELQKSAGKSELDGHIKNPLLVCDAFGYNSHSYVVDGFPCPYETIFDVAGPILFDPDVGGNVVTAAGVVSRLLLCSSPIGRAVPIEIVACLL